MQERIRCIGIWTGFLIFGKSPLLQDYETVGDCRTGIHSHPFCQTSKAFSFFDLMEHLIELYEF